MEDRKFGHKKMVIWKNIEELDELVQKEIIPSIPKFKFKTINQIDGASDSIGSNFVEGYYANSVGEYLRFCYYSKRSLAELDLRVARCKRKGYIPNPVWLKFSELVNKTMYLFNRLISSLQKLQIDKKSRS